MHLQLLQIKLFIQIRKLWYIERSLQCQLSQILFCNGITFINCVLSNLHQEAAIVFVLYVHILYSVNIVLSYFTISTFILYYNGYVNIEYGQIMPWMTRFIFKVIFHIFIDKPSKTFHVKMIQILPTQKRKVTKPFLIDPIHS